MTILAAMRSYLMQCPVLRGQAGHLEWTGDEEGWALSDKGESVQQRYWDTSELRCRRFSLAIRRYASDDEERGDNAACLEQVSDWLSRQQLLGNVPRLPQGKQVERLEALDGALCRMDEDSVCGTYHLQIVLYYEERRRELE